MQKILHMLSDLETVDDNQSSLLLETRVPGGLDSGVEEDGGSGGEW